MQLIKNLVASFKERFEAFTEEAGQTLVEYGLILALISIVAIAALSLIGTNVTAVFNSIAGDLSSAGGGTP